jgi:predicted N-acetyltransferase YhbS
VWFCGGTTRSKFNDALPRRICSSIFIDIMSSSNSSSSVVFRLELEQDHREVEAMTREAFWNLYSPGADEHALLHRLRKAPEFIPELAFVAAMQDTGEIVGSIVYSHGSVTADSGADGRDSSVVSKVLTFGSVCVKPSVQCSGIGDRLIRHSLLAAATLGHGAVVIQGDPSYYRRFGFESSHKFLITTATGSYPKGLQALELFSGALNDIQGRFAECSAFEVEEEEVAAFDATFPPKEKYETTSQKAFQMIIKLKWNDPDIPDIGKMWKSRDRIV